MSKVVELMETVKAAKGIESKYALAKTLNISTQRIGSYYNGKAIPNNDACLEIAKALNRDLTEIIALVEMDNAKDEKRRVAWREYFKSIGGIAASIALVFCFIFDSDTCYIGHVSILNCDGYAICIMLNIKSKNKAALAAPAP